LDCAHAARFLKFSTKLQPKKLFQNWEGEDVARRRCWIEALELSPIWMIGRAEATKSQHLRRATDSPFQF
jgi:hypothetical protein